MLTKQATRRNISDDSNLHIFLKLFYVLQRGTKFQNNTRRSEKIAGLQAGNCSCLESESLGGATARVS